MHRLLRASIILQHVLQRALKVLKDIPKVFLLPSLLFFIRFSASAGSYFGCRGGL